MKSGLNKGTLIKWNDERGFGFIKPDQGGKEVFLHISAVKTTGRRPLVGDTIFYERVYEADGKMRASNASIQGVVSRASTTQSRRPVSTRPRTKHREWILTIVGCGAIVSTIIISLQQSPSTAPPPITAITKPACVIKGNISVASGNRLYHLPGMEDYENTVIDPAKGERWFCSEAEAAAAGWRKAPR